MIRLLLAFALTGCSSLKFEAPGEPATVTRTLYGANYFWGIFSDDSPPTPACPAGAFREATMRMSASDVLLTGATFGIYVPHRTVVNCAK